MEESPRVTIVCPFIRYGLGKETLQAIQKHCTFPHKLIAIIHPNLENLVQWSMKNGITVIEDMFIPIARVKKASLELCETPYLMLFNSQIRPINSMKPILDLMEKHPEIGVCSATKVKPFQGGSFLQIKKGIVHHTKASQKIIKQTWGEKEYHICDYVIDEATIYRKEIFNDVMFDTTFASGYAHLDFFMQLKQTNWKAACHHEAQVIKIPYDDPFWYKTIREVGKGLSKARFMKKWGVRAWKRGK